MQNLKFERLANLDQLTLEHPGRRGCVVLLHGFGADFTDLSSLATVADPAQEWNWYFPNGPLEVHISDYARGRAWFPIDMEALERAMRTGERRYFATHEPKGLAAASEQIQALLALLAQRYETVCLGGFSQGAMVSCDAALVGAQKPQALLQLSGTYLAEQRWAEALAAQTVRFPVLQSHGRHDPVLPFSAAEELQAFWQKNNFPSRFLPFQGGHEIPFDVLQALRIFLKELLPRV